MIPGMFKMEDYYLGWVIQLLEPYGNFWYVYPRDDTRRPLGFTVIGSEMEACRFIESKFG